MFRGTWFYSLAGGNKILFPFPYDKALGINECGQVLYMRTDAEGRELPNTMGLWSLCENSPVLSGCYAEILCCYGERNLYAVRDCRGHLQLRSAGDGLLEDYGRIDHVYKWHFPDEQDPIFIISRGDDDKRRRAYNILQGKMVGPEFRAIGKLREGMRYMRTPDERHIFVNAEWEFLFELPAAPFIGGIGAKGDPTASLVCRDGVIAVEEEDSAYLINREGNWVIPPKRHKHIFTVGADRIIVSKGARYALASKDGSVLTDFLYRAGDQYTHYFYEEFSENRLAIRKQSGKRLCKYGFLDTDGNEAVPFVYDMIPYPGRFSFGCAVVGVGDI